MTPAPQPTVGRIVHFTPHDEPGPWAAMVTAVDGDQVNLAVFAPGRIAGYITRPVPFADTPTPGHWNWPPRVEQKEPTK